MINRRKPIAHRKLRSKNPAQAAATAHRRTCERCGVEFICGRFAGLDNCCTELAKTIQDPPCYCPKCRDEVFGKDLPGRG